LRVKRFWLELCKIFENLSTSNLYIAGESYAAQLIPVIASKLVSSRTANVAGIIIGNGLFGMHFLTLCKRAFVCDITNNVSV
jgi:carboxypeptidase C (cathepsin A)